MNADTIAGYTYCAENWHGSCVVEVLVDNTPELQDFVVHHPVTGAVDVEPTLDAFAKFAGIDRHDENTYDTDDFPKVINADQVQWDTWTDVDGQVVGESERCSCEDPLVY